MNTQLTQQETTKDLRHSILAHDAKGNPIYIKIRLNDECKNGHQDFAITADIYEKGKPKTDRYFISGGCCHEEIVKAAPDLEIFVRLHLCDWEGIPMYAVENGYYHLTNGFNQTKPNESGFKEKFCEYYRLTPQQFDELSTVKNALQYALKLQSLNILGQWKKEANKAIELLEQMTGKNFEVCSPKSQFNAPTKEQIKEEQEKQKSGYYTPEKEAEREEEKKNAEMEKLEAEEQKELNKISEEYWIKKQVLRIGGSAALKNCIYYNHSRTLSFNWKSYDLISAELYNNIAANIGLPEGVTIENKNGK